jgi:hypothetical protein
MYYPRLHYREVGDSLSIGVSTDDVAGETDWFDLGLTIAVEGRQVVVLRARRHTETYLLLIPGWLLRGL